MVSVSEASSIIESHLYIPEMEEVELSRATHRVLAEVIVADRDFPPFSRVAMDGIAIQYHVYQQGQTIFNIEDVAPAGAPARTLKESINCIEVMTGAPLPGNTDAVIRYEDIEIKDKVATILAAEIFPGQNIHPQAQDAKKDQVLLEKGTLLSPSEVALIASVGKTSVTVMSNPSAAIISTGDELVDIRSVPLPHQIRRSNSYALLAGLNALGCEANLFHISDEREKITLALKTILQNHDLIILSGGVSKGKFDFIPESLVQLGVKKHFHRVSQKPGKPFWFGSMNNKIVFALPGNPVSTYMCFYRYVKPWLKKSWHQKLLTEFAILSQDFQLSGDLTYFLQVKVTNEAGVNMAYPVPGGGSGDFANLKDADAFMELPANKTTFKKGEAFPVYYFRQR